MFEDKYRVGEKIGEGAHGLVRKCYLKENDKLFAVKTIRLEPEHLFYLKENFKTISNLSHPNLLRYYALFLETNRQTCHLVMEYSNLPDMLKIKIPS